MTPWRILALVALFPSISIADEAPFFQPLVTTVENLGSIPASQAASGLGFNINPANEWEFRMAAEAGAVEGRVQFSWEAVENFDGDLALSPAAENALGWFAQYGLQPLIVAAYGPPRRRVLTITVGRDVPSGSYQIPADEDLSGVEPFCHVQRSNGAQIVPGQMGLLRRIDPFCRSAEPLIDA